MSNPTKEEIQQAIAQEIAEALDHSYYRYYRQSNDRYFVSPDGVLSFGDSSSGRQVVVTVTVSQ